LAGRGKRPYTFALEIVFSTPSGSPPKKTFGFEDAFKTTDPDCIFAPIFLTASEIILFARIFCISWTASTRYHAKIDKTRPDTTPIPRRSRYFKSLQKEVQSHLEDDPNNVEKRINGKISPRHEGWRRSKQSVSTTNKVVGGRVWCWRLAFAKK
jgi:hypothetical protein